MKEDNITKISIVAISMEAKKKHKMLAKNLKKPMGDIYNEAILNYNNSSTSPRDISSEGERELLKLSNEIREEIKKFLTKSNKPWWKLFFCR